MIHPPSRLKQFNKEIGGYDYGWYCNRAEYCAEWCQSMKDTYGIQPQVNWGRLPAGDIRKTYRNKQCGKFFMMKSVESLPMSVCRMSQYTLSTQLQSPLPLIAVMAASTTRGVAVVDLETFSLFSFLLPSLVRSVECGYRYLFVLGYDVGDPFFDSEQVLI